jgi:nucleoid-associated protein YgaU
MSEPIWNPGFEPRYDAPEELTSPKGQAPSPSQAPTASLGSNLDQAENPPTQASSIVSSLFSSHPAIAFPAGASLFPQGNLAESEPDEPEPEEDGLEEDEEQDVEEKVADDDESPMLDKASRTAFLARIVPLARGAWTAAGLGWDLARRYPRASLASGLSVAILAGVMILQPGKGKHDTTVQIGGSPAKDPAKGAPPDSAGDPDVAAGDQHGPASDPRPATPPSPPIARTDLLASAPKSAPTGSNSPALLESSPVKPAPAPVVDSLPTTSPAGAGGLAIAPAPDAGLNDHVPLPPVEPVKLTAGEGLVALPSIEASPAQSPVSKEAAPAPPLLELAAADVKPGTPPAKLPEPAPAHAPAAGSTSVPASKPAPAPAPALSPASAPAPGSALKPAPAPGPAQSPGPAKNAGPAAPVASASGKTGAAVVAGSVGFAVGTGIGAAVTALTKGPGDKDKPAQKAVVKPEPARPAPSPVIAPVASGPVSPSAPPVLPKPLETSATPHPETPKVTPIPAPHESTGAHVLPVPLPVPSRIEPADSVAELPPLHPATDADLSKDHGADTPIQAPSRSAPLTREPSRRAGSSLDAVAPSSKDDLATAGWVPIKHTSGAAVQDVQREEQGLEDDTRGGTAMAAARDANDPGPLIDDRQSFDLETPRSRTADAAGDQSGRKPPRSEGKLDTVLHKVEGKENFWDISRMYYNSGRYYKALWVANIDKVPQVDKLYRGTVIRIPPPEDLDPAYIDSPSTKGKRPAESALARQETDPGDASSSRTDLERTSSHRTAPGDGVPIRRSSRSDADLNLPVSNVATEDSEGKAQSSRGVHRVVVDDGNEPEYRPRDAVTRPIYKVREYDTLRTIARDTLGDARRASEILDLNRDIIDDPRHLIVGQILELPEDARTGRTRSRR